MGETLPNPSNRASYKRYVMRRLALHKSWVPLLVVALGLVGCAPGVVEPPTPFPRLDTPKPPTPVQPAVESSAIPEELAEPPEPTATPRVAIPSRPVEEPRLEVGEPVIIEQIWMDSATDGWAIGSHLDAVPGLPIHVLRTHDGGQTWSEVTPPEDNLAGIGGIESSGSNAWVIYLGSDRVWRTSDGGATWTASKAGYPEGQFSTIEFSDALHGWMLQEVESGFGSQLVSLFRTADGGDIWQEIINPYESEDLQSCLKTGMSFFGINAGWVTYDCEGTYLEAFLDVSGDAGESWTEGQLPTPDGAAQSTDEGWCYSSSPHQTGNASGTLIVTCVVDEDSVLSESAYLYSTEDAGETWNIRDYPGGEPHFFDAKTILALARDQYRSTDSGMSWEKIKTVSWDGIYSFVNPDRGWAVAVNEDEIALVATSDSGRTWEILRPLIASE